MMRAETPHTNQTMTIICWIALIFCIVYRYCRIIAYLNQAINTPVWSLHVIIVLTLPLDMQLRL